MSQVRVTCDRCGEQMIDADDVRLGHAVNHETGHEVWMAWFACPNCRKALGRSVGAELVEQLARLGAAVIPPVIDQDYELEFGRALESADSAAILAAAHSDGGRYGCNGYGGAPPGAAALAPRPWSAASRRPVKEGCATAA